ncbi:MAG: hypothetical protein FDW93_00750 [Bergeyella sp.]|nr:hypothetical protein [Bergeyella sp.]
MKTYGMLIVLFLLSCRTRPVAIENTREVVTTVRDTVYTVSSDSAYYKAYIECKKGIPVLLASGKETRKGKKRTYPKYN